VPSRCASWSSLSPRCSLTRTAIRGSAMNEMKAMKAMKEMKEMKVSGDRPGA
jgi:hypothetical protein